MDFVTNVTAGSSRWKELCNEKLVTMTLIQKLKSGWTALKFLRVGLGGLILYSSIAEGNTAGMILGGLFTVISLFTDGVCCFTRSCYSPPKKNNSSKPENIEYEELGTK